MADMGFSQEMKMQQSLAPQLYQSLEILQMPLLDLQNLVKQELIENPTLEITDKEADVNLEVEIGTSDTEKFDAEIESLEDGWTENFKHNNTSNLEDKYQYLMDSLTESISLQDYLVQQLDMVKLSPQERKVSELIIGSIDDDGYLQLDTEEISESPNFPTEMFEKIITTIQSFDPAGICSRDLKECLMLQLERAGKLDEPEYILVKNYLDLLGRNRLEIIAEKMSISLSDIKKYSETIAKLDPKPGQQVNQDMIEYITPEVFIELNDGKYEVRANRKPYPQLFINQNYLRLLKDKSTAPETKKYIREKLAKSRLIIQSIDQRLSIVERIALQLVDIQSAFFKEGEMGLKPLNMKVIAEKLGVHETTISRATSGKYMQTPRGLLEMKYFFTTAIKSISGATVSNEYAKKVLADIIKSENKKKPYSDSKLVELLKNHDILISRRTVAKYRDQLRILASSLRKEI